MFIQIDGKDYKLPASLMEIPLSLRIDYENTYGKALSADLKKIVEMPDGLDRELALIEYHFDLACKTISFFGNVPLPVVCQTKAEGVISIYHSCLKSFSDDINFKDESYPLKTDFFWNDADWQIQPPELQSDSTATFGEFLDAKQSIKNLYEFGNEHWESLHLLCCIYFRRKGEPYTEELSKEGGERYKLMQSLPLEMAIATGFFLNCSLLSYENTSKSFGHQRENPPGDLLLTTMSVGAG